MTKSRANKGDYRKESGRVSRLLGHLLFLLVIFAAWEAWARLSGLSAVILPPFSEVISDLVSELLSGRLLGRIGFSLLIIGEGLGLGILLALLLSLGSRADPRLSSVVESLIAFLHPLPGIALLPLIILWAGTGVSAVLVIIVHSVVWPLTTNLRAGFDSVPRHLFDLARTYRLTSREMLQHLLLPSSFPFFLAGLRIGWARAWRALIAAEMVFGAIGARGGIGWFIFQKRVFMDTSGLFAGILTVMIIGVVVEEFVFETLERKTLHKWGLSE